MTIFYIMLAKLLLNSCLIEFHTYPEAFVGPKSLVEVQTSYILNTLLLIE